MVCETCEPCEDSNADPGEGLTMILGAETKENRRGLDGVRKSYSPPGSRDTTFTSGHSARVPSRGPKRRTRPVST